MAILPNNAWGMAAPRMMSHRYGIFILVAIALLSGFIFVSGRLSNFCLDGSYCRETLTFGTHSSPLEPTHDTADLAGLSCDNFPDTSNILLIMKTGASESYSKIPTQLLTNLRCQSDYLIFSDMAQTISGVEIHDSLDTVTNETMKDNNDFRFYLDQKSCPIDQDSCNKNTDSASSGWALDKYKNVHIAEKTYRMRPNYDWYLYVDADTYVVWATLKEWVKHIKPSERHYIGSVAMLGDFRFAHGGSGYLVSQGAMKAMFKDREGVANRYDMAAAKTCCGDYLFARAMMDEMGVAAKNVWPTVNGEKPVTLAFGDRQWCHPIATMHHVGSEEVSDIDASEHERGYKSPLRIKDIYHRFFKPKLVSARYNWDNLSEDVYYFDETDRKYTDREMDRKKTGEMTELEEKAHLSFIDCGQACKSLDTCFQYRFHEGTCSMSYTFQHGNPLKKEEEDEKRWKSGWDVLKIEAWVKTHDDCGKIQWPDTSI